MMYQARKSINNNRIEEARVDELIQKEVERYKEKINDSPEDLYNYLMILNDLPKLRKRIKNSLAIDIVDDKVGSIII